MMTATKFLLPLMATLLLASIAIWPVLDRARDQTRIAFRRAFGGDPDAVRILGPQYRGVDERSRPYTITADVAVQTGPEQIDLTEPKGDLITASGAWIMVESRTGVYIQHQGVLDLWHDVVLYRDDGTTLRSDTATVDVKSGAAASNDQTHAEGPFGTLDSQGFALIDKGAVVQFQGPSRLVPNGASGK